MIVLAASGLVVLTSNFGQTAITPLAPFLVPRNRVGLLLSAQSIASCATLLFIGRVVDRRGSLYVLWRGLALQALSIVLCAGASFPLQMLSRFSQGLATGACFNAGVAFVIEQYDESMRSGAIGKVLSIGAVGGLLGPPVTGWTFQLAEGLPCRQVFAMIPLAFSLLCACFALKHIPSTMLTPIRSSDNALIKPLIDAEKSDGIREGELEISDGILRRLFAVYIHVGPPSWVLALTLTWCWSVGKALLTAGTLILQSHGYTAGIIGAATVPAVLLQIAVAPWAGRVAGPCQRRKFIVGSMIVLSVGLIITGVLSRVPSSTTVVGLIVLANSVSSLAMALVDAPSIDFMTSLAAARGCGAGEAVTASEMAVTGGAAIGPILGQAILNSLGFQGLCFTSALIAALLSMLCNLVLPAFITSIPSPPASPQSITSCNSGLSALGRCRTDSDLSPHSPVGFCIGSHGS